MENIYLNEDIEKQVSEKKTDFRKKKKRVSEKKNRFPEIKKKIWMTLLIIRIPTLTHLFSIHIFRNLSKMICYIYIKVISEKHMNIYNINKCKNINSKIIHTILEFRNKIQWIYLNY